MTEDVQKLHDERVNRFVTTANLNEPDRVPVVGAAGSGVIYLAGYGFADLLENYELEEKLYVAEAAKQNEYVDSFGGSGINHQMKIATALGSKTFFISPNGINVQHHETSSMKVEEYDEFIADPMKFIADKIATRKVTGFQLESDEEVYANLASLFDKAAEIRRGGTANRIIRERFGLPGLTGGGGNPLGGSIAHPCDVFFDFIRGFKETMTDMRRRPERVDAAIAAISPFYERNIPTQYVGPFPWMNDTHHIATFLTGPLFERYYWPFYKKSVEGCYNAGIKLISVFEGPWEQHFDLLDELPKTSMIAQLEKFEQVVNFKKRYANQFAIYGGMTGMLRLNTFEDSLERVKKTLDIAAPGGGYIFSPGGISAPGDGTPERQEQICRWVFENANY
ncbi:MAG: hypothetical protein FWG10_01830 [Eubacteriaceae bacterium]|nr:hypothetical protein [Eubacteriaceae bacterium]